MKRAIIALVFLSVAALSANAATDVWNDTQKPPRSDAEMDAQVQTDGSICDREVGAQSGLPSARYRSCMARYHWVFSHMRRSAPRSTPSVVVHDRDSRDPNIGWHWEGGMRVCHQDCDNPEIPGSGYTCRDVGAMRECDKSN
jgi:hypothetical protein